MSDRQVKLDVAKALRTVSEKLSYRSWETGIEEAFRMLASELDAQAHLLDPLPFIWVEEGPRKGYRQELGADDFFGPKVKWDPRVGYNQYQDMYENRKRELGL